MSWCTCILLVIWCLTAGAERASRLWADYVRRVMEDDGSETIAVFSMVFVNRSKRYIVAVWGDDFAFTVASEMLPPHRAAGAELPVQAHREHRSWDAAESGEAPEPAAGMD